MELNWWLLGTGYTIVAAILYGLAYWIEVVLGKSADGSVLFAYTSTSSSPPSSLYTLRILIKKAAHSRDNIYIKAQCVLYLAEL